MPGLAAHGVGLRYGTLTVLSEVTIDFQSGQVTYLLGANGAGKSTLMRVLAGQQRPDAGSVRRGSGDSAANPLREIGVHLDVALGDPARRVLDHLRWAGALADCARSRSAEVAAQVEVTPLLGRRLGTLSLGQRQRVGIATALLADPPCLLFDEPLNGLDVAGIRWIRGLLRDLADSGHTIVVASHNLREVAVTGDRVVVLAGGRIARDRALTEFGTDTESRVLALEDAVLESAVPGSAGLESADMTAALTSVRGVPE